MTILVISDYVIEEIKGLLYGICEINWKSPYDRYNIKIPFKLPNVTSLRVASQSLVFTLQAIFNASFIDFEHDDIIIGVKNIVLFNAIRKPSWPSTLPQARVLGQTARNILDKINRNREVVKFLYVERDKTEDPIMIHLQEGKNQENKVDSGKSFSDMNENIDLSRFNDLRAHELIELGARCYRRKKLHN